MKQIKFILSLVVTLFSIATFSQTETASSCQGEISLGLVTAGPCGYASDFDPSSLNLVKFNTNIVEGIIASEWDYIEWDFGDGSPHEFQYSTSGSTITLFKQHLYAYSGTYTVSIALHLICDDLSTEIVNLSRSFHTVDDYNNFTYYATRVSETDVIFTYSGGYYENSHPMYGDFGIINAILSFGDGTSLSIPLSSLSPGTILATHSYVSDIEGSSFETELSFSFEHAGILFCDVSYSLIIESPPCDCFSFKPEGGKEYWFSAWVQEGHEVQVKNYLEASIQLTFITDVSSSTIDFYPTGEIIDGWQRIVGKFTMPIGVNQMNVKLVAHSTVDTYFDDIRIHPFNGSMKSYVYDGETFWLTSELDDNNYATFYEYDEEGGLVRIKKETARGIVTIQETRSNTIKTTTP